MPQPLRVFACTVVAQVLGNRNDGLVEKTRELIREYWSRGIRLTKRFGLIPEIGMTAVALDTRLKRNYNTSIATEAERILGRSQTHSPGESTVTFELRNHELLVIYNFFKHVAHRNQSGEFSVFINRQMPDIFINHHRHTFIQRLAGLDVQHFGRHDLANHGILRRFSLKIHSAYTIALIDNPYHLVCLNDQITLPVLFSAIIFMASNTKWLGRIEKT